MKDELILRSVEIERDAAALAIMWNESDDQWPGSWTGGVPMTAERMKREYAESDSLDVMVWATTTGDIAGYCQLEKKVSEPQVGYVHLLNVHPGYQKRSLARKLLVASVERMVEMGYRRLDLHTWPGNLKAVPLYKKTGFFWLPDTDVFMMNFVPAALACPLARPFFQRHNWYETFNRALEQKEDDERWRGIKTFGYEWAADGEYVRVWADREGRAIAAVETNDVYAAAIPAMIRPAKGMGTALRWEVRNKGDEPLAVSLVARGTEYLKSDYREAFVVAPGELAVREAAVAVDPQIPNRSSRRPAPKIETLMMINGQLLELGSGMEPQEAVVIEIDPRYQIVAPGVPRQVNVQLRNSLDVPVTAQVALTAPDGVKIDCDTQPVSLGPREHGGFPLTVRAAERGGHALQGLVHFSVDGQQGAGAPQPVPLFVGYPGETVVSEQRDGIHIVTDTALWFVEREGGALKLAQLGGPALRRLGMLGAAYGPPFSPDEFQTEEAELTWERTAEGVLVRTTLVSKRFPGLAMVRDLLFMPGGLIKVRYHAMNRHDQAYRPELLLRWMRNWSESCQMMLPLREGLLTAESYDFPVGELDVPREPEAFAEQWVALEYGHSALGLIWGDDVDQVRIHWYCGLFRSAFDCPPHAWAEPFEFWLVWGRGDWRQVRDTWAALAGKGPADRAPEPLIALETEPTVPLLTAAENQITLTLSNRRERDLEGRIALEPSAGWTVTPATMNYAGVNRHQPFQVMLSLKADNAEPGVYPLTARLATQVVDETRQLPLVRVGDGRPVVVDVVDGVWRIDNGRTVFRVAPGFAASMVGWDMDGQNHLNSAYPMPGAHGWMAPWYGGIWPILWPSGLDYPSKLYTEAFCAEPIAMTDSQGLLWRGLRCATTVQNELMRGMAVEIDYLTVGGSPLCKTVLRVKNQTKAVRHLWGGFTSFWKLDGDDSKAVLRGETWQSKRTNMLDTWVRLGDWGTLTNPETGRTVAVISPESLARVADEGISSHSLDLFDPLHVAPQGVHERVAYWVMAQDWHQARAYACLTKA